MADLRQQGALGSLQLTDPPHDLLPMLGMQLFQRALGSLCDPKHHWNLTTLSRHPSPVF
jgi:hypothetical protein